RARVLPKDVGIRVVAMHLQGRWRGSRAIRRAARPFDVQRASGSGSRRSSHHERHDGEEAREFLHATALPFLLFYRTSSVTGSSCGAAASFLGRFLSVRSEALSLVPAPFSPPRLRRGHASAPLYG